MHGKPQRSCKATVKSTEYARAGNHEAVISRPMTLRRPVGFLCRQWSSENNFAKLFSAKADLQMDRTEEVETKIKMECRGVEALT